MATFTRGPQIALAGGARSDDAGVRVVTINTVERGVLAGEEIAVLMTGVLDEAVGSDEIAGHVAAHALLAVAVDRRREGVGVVDVQAARAVARLALHAGQGESADHAGAAVLVALGDVTGGVTRATVVGQLLAGVIGGQRIAGLQQSVGEVQLGRLARHQVADLIDKVSLPVVAADDIGHVGPLQPFRQRPDSAVAGNGRGGSIDRVEDPRVAAGDETVVVRLVAFGADLGADELGRGEADAVLASRAARACCAGLAAGAGWALRAGLALGADGAGAARTSGQSQHHGG